ncbi:putative inorganic phosphate transporter C8E4.01c [Cyphellophora attinorum]|uniref:Putative inorganic phosphate transporter C8E4.01c n=1 Tax=Cyphellophora attinorum TaxID=1664694 RepID=A0A0N1NY53_9EURO|nr:putative inorganic phosphate transporter C8E4.01c [Phialophora attinorum]KPI36112.1 putative inorganic phosphate transporter C8E4.01c [Phialophora attinorum]
MANHQDPITYGPAAPHGPDVDGNHPSMVSPDFGMYQNEKEIFDSLLKPDDSYDADGTYWADMSIWRRFKFVRKVDAIETKREFGSFWSMFKADPLSPLGFYFRNMVLPGAGLGLEGYVLFSIGNLKPLFQKGFPNCWNKELTCSATWLAAVEYLEICGIIVGQILVGVIGDWIGRRWGLIQDATIMFIGLLMLTAAWGVTENGWVICYVWSLFFYGIGVGGEYPMTATAGMENAVGSGKVSTRDDRLHRGRKVTSAFLMQGWGQFFNQVLLILLLLIFHHGSGNAPYSKLAVQWTYRVSFAIPAVGTLWLVYYRVYKMKSASKQLQAAKKKSSVTGYDAQSLKIIINHFGGRLLATAGTWYMNDVFFYGNKLFQGEFIKVITPNNSSVMPGWLYNLINVGVALCGYYLASFLIDNKLYGRKHMQTVGFLMDFILFVVPAFNFEYYTRPEHIHSFQAMYFLSSFFNQFGPNSVTFIAAAEVYPTAVRATAHGFSAAVGKLGALTAAVLYNYIDTQTKFYVVPWFGLAGVLLTVVFMPDTTGLDLKEQERRWAFIRAGREQDYHGIAIHPKHLSLWERFRGVSKPYDPDLDYKQRIEEMRKEWEVNMQEKYDEKDGRLDREDFEDEDLPNHATHFFQRTTTAEHLVPREKELNEKEDYQSSSDSPTRR